MASEAILVVEDDAAMLDGLRDTLELAGYRVATAGGGASALVLLRTLDPDLILSDVMMPDMDGFELFRRVRAMPRHIAVPFVFLTARSERSDVRTGMQLGADDYITKPFDESELVDAVAARMRRRVELDAVRHAAYSRLAEQMVQTLNHELRAPLAQLAAFAELLEDAGDDLPADEFDRLIQGVHSGVSRLSSVVADVATLADLRSGRARARFEVRRQRVDDVPAILRSVAMAYRPRAAERGLVLNLDELPDLPAIVADEAYLRDAIGRLLDNAVKFSKAGGGTIRISAHADDLAIRISVADDGIGFDSRLVAEIFDPIRQLDRDQQEQQGLGSGLAIALGLVDLHGGTIEAESELGVGSTLVIRLPTGR